LQAFPESKFAAHLLPSSVDKDATLPRP